MQPAENEVKTSRAKSPDWLNEQPLHSDWRDNKKKGIAQFEIHVP